MMLVSVYILAHPELEYKIGEGYFIVGLFYPSI